MAIVGCKSRPRRARLLVGADFPPCCTGHWCAKGEDVPLLCLSLARARAQVRLFLSLYLTLLFFPHSLPSTTSMTSPTRPCSFLGGALVNLMRANGTGRSHSGCADLLAAALYYCRFLRSVPFMPTDAAVDRTCRLLAVLHAHGVLNRRCARVPDAFRRYWTRPRW